MWNGDHEVLWSRAAPAGAQGHVGLPRQKAILVFGALIGRTPPGSTAKTERSLLRHRNSKRLKSFAMLAQAWHDAVRA
eukprot:3955055-Prymnesium_polylepis.1